MSLDITKICSSHLTLRFKHIKQTFLIPILPSTPFTTIKSLLLEAILEQYPKGLPLDPSDPQPDRPVVEVPTGVEEIRIGLPKDKIEGNKEWEEIGTDEGETPEMLKVKDADMLAVAWVKEGEKFNNAMFEVSFPDEDELYPKEGEE